MFVFCDLDGRHALARERRRERKRVSWECGRRETPVDFPAGNSLYSVRGSGRKRFLWSNVTFNAGNKWEEDVKQNDLRCKYSLIQRDVAMFSFMGERFINTRSSCLGNCGAIRYLS